MSEQAVTRITLRALKGEPLADEQVRSTIVATAHAIAERTGIELISIETGPAIVTATLAASRIASIGFMAELRRLTTKWHHDKTGAESLWGEAPHVFSEDDWDEADSDNELDDSEDEDEDEEEGGGWVDNEDEYDYEGGEDDDEDEDDGPSYDVGEPWR